MRIDRCVCFQKPFSLLKEIAKSRQCQTITELQREVVFGEKCKMCHPYVRRMLETGEVVFSEVITETAL